MYFGKAAIFALVLGTSAFASPPERDRHHFSVASSKFICLERNNPCRYYEECCEDLICKNQKCQPKPICQSKNKPCGSIIGNKCCDGLFCAKKDVCKERQQGKLELFRVFAGASGRYDGGPDKGVIIDLGYDLAMSASGDCIAFPIEGPNFDQPRRVFVECIDYSTRAMAVTLPRDPRNSVITNDLFYDSMKVTMSGNGLVIAIGAYYAKDYVGMVVTYELKEGTWVEISTEIELPDFTVNFGSAIALSHDGTKMVVTAVNSGPDSNGFFQRYRLEEGFWIIEGDTVYGESADNMGRTIGMNSDGSRILVNGSERYVKVFDWCGSINEWHLVYTFENESGSEYFGYYHNEISSDGSVVAIGDYGFDNEKGKVEIFEEDQNGKFKSIFSVVGPGENSAYGYAFALSGDGKILAVSDYAEKENIVIYKRVGKTFVKQQIVKKEGTQTDTVRLNHDGTVLAFENNGYRGLQRYDLKMEMHVYAILPQSSSPTPSPTEKPTDTPTVPYVPPTSSPAPSS